MVYVEKDTLLNVLAPICNEYRVPLWSGKGFNSLTHIYKFAQEYENGGSDLSILYISDHDPSGLAIPLALDVTLLHDFYLPHELYRIALTTDQIEEHHLTASFQPVKMTDTRAKEYVSEHGNSVWEVEALEPPVLQAIVREAILDIVDVEAINQHVKAERRQARKMKKMLTKPRPKRRAE